MSEAKDVELLPCPNPECGSANVRSSHDYTHNYIYCGDCGLRGPWEANGLGIKWNSILRTPTPSPSTEERSREADFFDVDGPFEQTVDKYHGELWLDKDGTANFKFHIEGGDFTSAREALVAFIACLQERLERQTECPYYQQKTRATTAEVEQDEVSKALAELREMFPDLRAEIVHWTDGRVYVRVFERAIITPVLFDSELKPTLAEAMQQVREWKRNHHSD